MATIVNTPSGKWKAIVRLQGWPATIKTFRLQKDAKDWARATEDEMVKGVYIVRASVLRFTVANAVDRYLREVTTTKAKTTQQAEVRRAAIVKKELGKYSMAAVTQDVVIKFRDERLSGKDRKGPNEGPVPRANDTVRLELAFLGHLFEVAKEEWKVGLPYNPVKNVSRPKSHKRVRRLSPEEETKLFAALDLYSNPMLGWLVRIAIETAMRESEIVELKKHQLDLRKRTITLPTTKSGESRTVPLTRAATEIFRKAIANAARNPATNLIFPGEPGRDGTIRPYQFLSCWRTLKLRAGVSDYRFHDNRHKAISRLVEAGFSDQAIASITGHTEMQTLARYRHIRNQNLVKMLDDAETARLSKPPSRQNTRRRRDFRSSRRSKSALDRRSD